MIKRFTKRLAVFGTALLLSALTTIPAFAVSHAGHLDTASDLAITGWAWDSESQNTAVSVEITISGGPDNALSETVFTVPADQAREDLQTVLGSASHGFVYLMDWSKFAVGEYTVTASAVSGETKTPLIGSIIYKKEETPVSNPGLQPTGVANQSAYGPASALTPEQIAQGPGYSPSLTPTSLATPYYETGEADQFLGTFHATGYCGCQKCSGGYTLTYSGTIPQPNHTIAADLNLYPIGTKLMVNGIVYTVEDRGSSVVDNRIDIYFGSHEEALAFGLQNVDVYSVK